jgi:choline-sulfatase
MAGVSRSKKHRREPASPPASIPAARRSGRAWMAVAIAVALVAVGGVAWWRQRQPAVPERPARPNVVLVTLDTTRADRLGAYGYALAATPHLDRLAAGGVRFADAISPAPLTLPAHASLMTGRNPYNHGVRNNGHFVLAGDVPTLAERFAAAGYDTAAFVSSFVLDRQFGVARGFAHYDDGLDPPRGLADSLELERRGDRTVAAAAAWLAGRSAGTRPFFLWVHLYDAHDPYMPPASLLGRFEGRLYDGEIAFQDTLVGELLARVGHGGSASPLVVVAADHGESLGDHGESTHGLFVYEAAVKVPLIVSWPGQLTPRVVEPTVALADVAPTVVALAGLAPLEGVDGRSLVPLIDGAGDAEGASRAAYTETYFPQFFMNWSPLRSVRAGGWKLIDAPEPELYDLARDPGERDNVYAAEPARARALRRQLESMARAGGDRTSPSPISAEARQRLSALGYVSTPAPRPAGASAPDPKRMAPLFERLLEGNRALSRGRADEAERLARQVLAEDPANAFARLVLGRAQLAAGQHREAIASLRAYLASVPGSADAHHWMALAHLRQGDRARALAEEEAALAIDPRHGAALSLRAGLLFSAGRREEAVQGLGAAVAADPANALVRVAYADLLADAGRHADAEPEYRRVLDSRPNDVSALLGLGLLLARTDRLDDALAAFSRVLEIDPGQDEARFERGAILERQGRVAEARDAYQRLRDTAATRPDIREAAARRLAALPRQ